MTLALSKRSRALLFALAGALALTIAFGAFHRPADASTVRRLGTKDAPAPLSIVNATILGVVEGVTEYLPVSSTGHLLIAERLLNIGTGSDKAATDGYTVVIQLGAILAVLGIYRTRFVSMAEGLVGRSDDGRRSLIAVVVAFIPAALIGQVFGDMIKENLLTPWAVAVAWIVGGGVILAFTANKDRLRPVVDSVSDITIRHALIIGVAQTLALWPGTSRSLVTILAGLAIGLTLRTAVEFSFLLGFVTLSAASAYELLKTGGDIYDTFGLGTPLLGIVVAGVAAWFSVKFMIDWLNRRDLSIFGWYRIAAGVAVFALIALDKL